MFKNLYTVSTFSRLLLIRSFLKLQVTRECILGSWIYSNLGQSGPQTIELVALEHLEILLYTYNGENGVSLFLVVYNEDGHSVLDPS